MITDQTFASSNSYNNKWGYKPSQYVTTSGGVNTTHDNTGISGADIYYLPSPSVTVGDTIAVTNAANSKVNNSYVDDEYTVGIGARANLDLAPGEYSNTFIITATANPISYSIDYADNTGDSTVAGLPSGTGTVLSSELDIPLPTEIPTRTGYTFVGWCTTEPTNYGTTCSSNTPYPASTAQTPSYYEIDQTADNTSLTFYAVWLKQPSASCSTPVPNITYMQDINTSNSDTIAASLTTNTAYYLRDSRDNEPYCVGKLADGRIWMLDNLALDLVARKNDLNENNTNASNATLGYLRNGGGTSSNKYAVSGVAEWTQTYPSYSDPWINISNRDVVPTDSISTTGGYKVGSYYNYCAASAGCYCYGNATSTGTSSGNATEDICPKGWRLPTGNISGTEPI